jgi:uncharacterized protein (TIGR03067 family)
MSRLAVLAAIFVASAAALATAQAPDDKVVKAELERLQGVWKPMSAEYEGKPYDMKEEGRTLTISGDKVVQRLKDKVHVEGQVEIASPAKAVKRAYWKHADAKVNNSVIYFFVGDDTLVTCWRGKDETIPEWPTGFTTDSAEAGVYLVVWKREK